MINIRRAEASGGSNEQTFMAQLERERIPYRFGEVYNGAERQGAVILTDRFAVAFTPFTTGIKATLLANRFKPQVWTKSELLWQSLPLKQRLLLHK